MSSDFDVSKGKYWQKPLSLVDGCTPCSPGCDHCWLAGREHRFCREGEPGHSTPILTDEKRRFKGVVVTHPERLDIPLKRKKPTVYAVWSDLFHKAVPDSFIDDAMAVISECSRHTFLVLTKRPVYMRNVMQQYYEWPNLYLGLTVCNQQEADEKLPIFLQVPGKKFLSIEPMLGEIDLTRCGGYQNPYYNCLNGERSYGMRALTWGHDGYPEKFKVDAVLLGFETGAGARPGRQDWVRKVRDDCRAAGVPFFLKHLNKKDGRVLDGKTYDDLPWGNHAA